MSGISRVREHSLKLCKDQPTLDLRKFTFSQAEANMHNDPSADIVTASTVRAFQKYLEVHLKNNFDLMVNA